MGLFRECMPECARKVLDTADIVREAMLQQSGRAVRALRPDFDLYAVSRAQRWLKTVSARAFQIQNDPGDPAVPGRYADPPHKVVAHVDRFASYPCGRLRNIEVDAVGISESYGVQVEVLRQVDKKADKIWTGFVADPW